MTTPRSLLVSNTQPMFYHLVSRCVRQSWLCGKHNGKDYSHRKDWLLDRLHQLGRAFAIQVHAYAIMSNHFHLVVYYDPTIAAKWSDEDVADRWLRACPPMTRCGLLDTERLPQQRRSILDDSERLRHIRAQLGSQSTFMQMLKQPIARRANLEDKCTGHFFENRFYSGALLSEEAILAAMAYVDLNPIRAKIAKTLEGSTHTSIAERLNSGAFDLEEKMTPIVCGFVKAKYVIKVRLGVYLEQLNLLMNSNLSDLKQLKWQQRVATLRKRQRAYGNKSELQHWLGQRGMQWREVSFP